MANWLDKALGRQREEPAPEPVPFELPCDCGLVLSGVRSERGRRVICTQCGRAQFVLPINRYPVTERRFFGNASNDADESDNEGLRVVPEDDEAVDDEFVDDAFGDNNAARSQRSKSRVPKKEAANERRSPPRLETLKTQRRDRSQARKQVLVVIGVFMLLAIGMLIWAIISHRREQSERIFKESGEAGLAAFDNGDFVKAETQLRDAVIAADSLRLTEVQAATVRSRSRHAESLVRLSDIDLFELVTAAEKMQTETWLETFAIHHRGKWVIFSASAKTQPIKDADGKEHMLFDLPGFQPPVQLAGLDHVTGLLRGPLANTDVLMAGQLEECLKIDGAWRVTFRPSSAFFWQDFNSLQRMGLFFEQDDEARMQYRGVVERQTAVVQAELKANSESPNKK